MAGRPQTTMRLAILARLVVVTGALLTCIAVFILATGADAFAQQLEPTTTDPAGDAGGGAPTPGVSSGSGSSAGTSAPTTSGPDDAGGGAPLPGSDTTNASDDSSGAASAPSMRPGQSPSASSDLTSGAFQGQGTGQLTVGYQPPASPAYSNGVQGASAPDMSVSNHDAQEFDGGVIGDSYTNSGFNATLNKNVIGNTFAGSGLFDPLTSIANSSSGKSWIGSGDADARGSFTSNGIHQEVVAYTDSSATIDILQVALIVNIGVSHATTGKNTGLGLGHGASPAVAAGSVNPNASETMNGKSVEKTGDASGIGNRGNTHLYQGASAGANDHLDQGATLVNVGIGIGNSGFNIVIGNINVEANPLQSNGSDETGWATTVRSGDSKIGTGSALSIGNMSTTDVAQVAIAHAFDGGALSLSQQAVVINFGFALANTGENAGVGDIGGGEITPAQQALANSVLAALLPLIGGTIGTDPNATATPLGDGTYSANGKSNIATGDAYALGNDTKTGVIQRAEGEVHGAKSASINQSALVGNFGFGLANTGDNAGVGNVEPGAVAQVSASTLAVQNQLTGFLGLLTNPDFLNSADPKATLNSVIDLGVAALTLSGDISAADMLATWDSSLPTAAGMPFSGLRVRQVSAVLDLGISFSDTGGNTAIGIYSNHKNQIAPQDTTGDPGSGTNDPPTNGGSTTSSDPGEVSTNSDLNVTNARTGIATLGAGDASAIGSMFAVWVCQRELVDASFCLQPAGAVDHKPGVSAQGASSRSAPARAATPVVVPSDPVVDVPAPAPTASESRPATDAVQIAGASLPFTGAEAESAAALGVVLVVLGGAAVTFGRRRRKTDHAPVQAAVGSRD